MPNHTVSGNVDTMMRAADNAAIRSAIGVGTTDAPTFLAQTLTGQSLTGTQATSLVDLAATWNTTGNPSLIYGRVTNTNSGTTANLIDLGTFAGGSLFKVNKEGLLALPASGGNGGGVLCGGSAFPNGASYIGQYGVRLAFEVQFSWSSGTNLNSLDLSLCRDAAGILAQRNGTSAQAFRVYDTYDTAGTNYERGTFGFPVGTNTLRIGTEQAGTGTAQPIDFVTGGVVRMSIAAGGAVTVAANLNVNDFVSTTDVSAGTYIMWGGGSRSRMTSPLNGIITLYNSGATDFGRLQLGGTTSAFPAIKRNGAGIDIRLADDSGPAPLTAAKLELVTTAATGVRESILRASVSDNATSAFHIYNGTAIDGKFVPSFSGSVFDSASATLSFAGQTNSENDTGTVPLMVFTARTTNSTSDPNNGTIVTVATRPLFAWWNQTTSLMQMSANGNLGIGTTTPASKLQVSAGDIEVDTIAKGVILKSPDGTRYRVTAANGGTLSVTAV